MTNVQKYMNAGFTKLQAEIIVGDLNNHASRYDKEIKEIKEEILYLHVIISSND